MRDGGLAGLRDLRRRTRPPGSVGGDHEIEHFRKLALARRRGAGIAAAALAACGAALAPAAAQAAGYSFQTINDPADIPPLQGPAVTFTNLMGITSNGDTIPGFYGSGQAGDPNTEFVLTLPSKTFTADNASFPGLVPPFNAAQTQMTAINGNGTTFTGYTYPTNTGVAIDFQFGFYEQGGVFHMVNNPKTPDCGIGRLRSRGDNRKPVDRSEQRQSRGRLL